MAGWKGVTLGLLLVAVLGAAIAYSLWPDSGDPGTPPRRDELATQEAPRKSLAERIRELDRQVDLSDAGVAALTGIVVDPDGKPVAGAEVWVTAGDGVSALDGLECEACGASLFECSSVQSAREVLALARAGKLSARSLASTKSGADGKFAFASVPATELTVHAKAPHLSEGEAGVDLAYAPEPGEEPFGTEIALERPVPLSGVVLDDKGDPVIGARLSVLDRRSGSVTDLTSADRGRFTIRGSPDSVQWVFIEAAGFLPSVTPDLYFPSGEEEPAEVRLERPHRLRVETRLSGQPVDAQISLTGSEHPRTLTASGGTALVEDLPSGTYEVSASYQTYVSPRTYVEVFDSEATVRVDLRPAARLSVAVLDERMEPISDARVSVDGYGQSELQVTGEDGALVVFESLAEGAYQVHVEAVGLRDAQRRVDLKPGDNHLDVVLQKASRLAGKVVDDEGKPVPSATIELLSQIHEAAATTSDEDGHFELQVDEAGSYRVRAREPQVGMVIAQVTAPAEELVLKLEPLARVEVKVTAERNPVKGAYVTVFGTGSAGEDSGTAVTDERGVARLAGLHGGEYMINVEQSGFQRPEPRHVKVAAHAKTEVTIALEKGVEITGRVIDEQGRGVANADVHTMPPEPLGKTDSPVVQVETMSAFTDENGAFSLEGLRPGQSYTLAASADDAASRASVKVKAPATGVVLKLQALPGVRGRVIDERGQPMHAFRVDGREMEAADGRFVIGREPDADGKLYLNVDADGYETLVIEREYAAELGDLRMKKAPLLVGIVVDQAAQAVSGAEVTCDQCIDQVTTGSDGRFQLAVSQDSPEPMVTASRLNFRGKVKAPAGTNLTVRLEPPVRVDGIVKDPGGRPLQARVIVREINGAQEERVDSGPDGRFELDLPEGLWMFITRMSATGQTVRVAPPRTTVVLGAPPGTCAVTITVSEPVGDAWLVPGEPERVPLEQLDDDALYAGAVALDLPVPNRPTRSAGLTCGVYTLITTDSTGVRRERVDVRASEARYTLGPGPPPSDAAPSHPGQP